MSTIAIIVVTVMATVVTLFISLMIWLSGDDKKERKALELMHKGRKETGGHLNGASYWLSHNPKMFSVVQYIANSLSADGFVSPEKLREFVNNLEEKQ